MDKDNILISKCQQIDNSTPPSVNPDDHCPLLTGRELRLLTKELRAIRKELSETETIVDLLDGTLDKSEAYVEENKYKLGLLGLHDTETRECLRQILILEKRNREDRKHQATAEGQLVRLRTRVREQKRILKTQLKEVERKKKRY